MMRLLSLATLTLAGTASASIFSVVTLPLCSRSCVEAQAAHLGCDAEDVGCLCDPLNDFYDTSLINCLSSACSSSDNIRFDNQWSGACQEVFTATNTFLNPEATDATIPSSISYPTGSELAQSTSTDVLSDPTTSDIFPSNTDVFPTNTLYVPSPTFTQPTFGGSGGGGSSDDGGQSSSSSPSSSSSSRRKKSKRLSAGGIAGIVIGVVVAVSGGVTSLVLWIRKHNAAAAAARNNTGGSTEDGARGDGDGAEAAKADAQSDDNHEFAKYAVAPVVTVQEDPNYTHNINNNNYNNNNYTTVPTREPGTGAEMAEADITADGIPRRPIIVYERVNGEDRVHQYSDPQIVQTVTQSYSSPNHDPNMNPGPYPPSQEVEAGYQQTHTHTHTTQTYTETQTQPQPQTQHIHHANSNWEIVSPPPSSPHHSPPS